MHLYNRPIKFCIYADGHYGRLSRFIAGKKPATASTMTLLNIFVHSRTALSKIFRQMCIPDRNRINNIVIDTFSVSLGAKAKAHKSHFHIALWR